MLQTLSKKPCFVKAESWKEVCCFLQANIKNYKSKRKKIIKELPFCYFLLDGKLANGEDELNVKFNKACKIEVVPAVVQCEPGSLLAAVLIAVVTSAVSFALQQLLAPSDPKNIRTSSYIISGKTNIAARNTPVPIGYGRLRIAPPVVNVLEINRDFEEDDITTDSSDDNARNNPITQWQSDGALRTTNPDVYPKIPQRQVGRS